ncbi:MAG TPA: carboxypeptidase regulatory-like domain-containing protein, partial [Gemmatimonadaceae bacterium]|nr:carboxypeptidase regulatory-like domain-containing protein [Gemmatimonadaceae bacterium]
MLLLSPNARANAQGIASSGIRGTIRADGADGARLLSGAYVNVTHSATGFPADVEARQGRFLIEGLEPGGPYVVTVRRLGFVAQRVEGVVLKLGEVLELDFVLRPVAAELDSVIVVANHESSRGLPYARGGTAATIDEPLLSKLPSLNRDFYDFVRLVPQISTKVGSQSAGFSAGGVGFQFNNFLVNGVSDRTTSTSVSSPSTGAKSVSLDAVQEYQVLVAPYDVRYGDFAGALVNTVTKSGTNVLHGSAFVYARNDLLARRISDSASAGYDRVQYGFSLGGPIVRDRLHFFIAPEVQYFAFPAAGPYVGQSANAGRAVPVSEADLARLNGIMRQYGLAAGSAGPVENGNPLRNLFSRLDLAVPAWNSRVVAWSNYSGSDDTELSRAAPDTFSLSTNQVTRASTDRLSAIQIHTTLSRAGGGHNELLLSDHLTGVHAVTGVRQPIVRVLVQGTTGSPVLINTGTHETGQDTWIHSSTIVLQDNLTIPVATSHIVAVGGEVERFRIQKGGIPGGYGAWTFGNLDSLELGAANRYDVGLDLGDVTVPLTGAQYAAYLSDQWEVHRRLSVTAGLRADLFALDGHAPYEVAVDTAFGRRTDQMPRSRIELAPRVGFIWDVGETRRDRIRGGAGIFTSRYPLAWVHTALSSYGSGLAMLRCVRTPRTGGQPPSFSSDYSAPPTACANDPAVTQGDVDLLDRNLRMMRTARGSLAYDATLPGRFTFTGEALLTRALSDFAFVNLNLKDPTTTDLNGRVMYGSISPQGIATAAVRTGFSEVIDLRNTSGGRSYQISARLEKELTDRATGAISYTYSRVRDAQTPVRANIRGTSVWATARVLSGRDDDFAPGISSNDIPHRVVVFGAYAMPWVHWRSELSFYYIGESGRPFTYVAWGTRTHGDLNADGSNANDPIYVPRSAFDTSEIRLDAGSGSLQLQQGALEGFIQG